VIEREKEASAKLREETRAEKQRLREEMTKLNREIRLKEIALEEDTSVCAQSLLTVNLLC